MQNFIQASILSIAWVLVHQMSVYLSWFLRIHWAVQRDRKVSTTVENAKFQMWN